MITFSSTYTGRPPPSSTSFLNTRKNKQTTKKIISTRATSLHPKHPSREAESRGRNIHHLPNNNTIQPSKSSNSCPQMAEKPQHPTSSNISPSPPSTNNPIPPIPSLPRSLNATRPQSAAPHPHTRAKQSIVIPTSHPRYSRPTMGTNPHTHTSPHLTSPILTWEYRAKNPVEPLSNQGSLAVFNLLCHLESYLSVVMVVHRKIK